ncbi:acyl-CoA dehydrogenase family protein [Amnibacterium setariae]|uniref:Acyl-CoA dehydrogenase C-terminal domain-containing protein n=1 Tax=Amnibacterium setariae TaxID=2306585 RepID=A0A3A1TWH3_9MICO|nr:hypothetical protein [Amnibacterium setariae]RIX28593.1 hypothetical protein D1781_14375 [Amnibacterium setariae]
MSAATSEAPASLDPAALRSTGVLRAFVPERFGGRRDTASGVARRIADVASWDADAGWLAAVAAVTNLAVTELPDGAQREVWGDGPDVLVVGTLAPQGAGAPAGDDLLVDAVSSPASGLDSADWVIATVLDRGTGAPTRVLVPVADVRVEATWNAIGLLGARGDTAHLESVRVPGHRRRPLPPAGGGAPLTFFATLCFGAAVVGAARGAAAAVTTAVDEAGPAGRWSRPDVRAATSAALRRAHRADALLEGAVAALGARTAVDALGDRARALAADAVIGAVQEAERALPELIGALGPAALAPDHPLARALADVTTGARHTALSGTKAALAHEAALFGRP